MSISIQERLLIIASCLIMSACTETIIREIPAAADPLTPEQAAAAPAIDGGIEMVPVTTAIGSTANMVPATSAEATLIGTEANMVNTTPATTTATTNTTVLETPATPLVATQPTTAVEPAILTAITEVPAVATPVAAVTPAMTVVPATVVPAAAVTPATTLATTATAEITALGTPITAPLITELTTTVQPTALTPTTVVPAAAIPAAAVTPTTIATMVEPTTIVPVTVASTTTLPATTSPTTAVTPTTVSQTSPLADPISEPSIVDILDTPATTTPAAASITTIDPLTGLPVFTSASTNPIPTDGIQLTEPSTDMIVGTPGISVDCQQTVPCRWVSDDLQFALTVTNADNIASLSHLSINYSVDTAHDTAVFVSQADDAIDANGSQFKAANQSLGGGNGGTPQGVLAGTPILGTLNFDAGTTSNSIDTWSISIMDGGMLRVASFTGIPVGTVTNAQADCQNILPCVWTSPSNDVAITLQSLGGVSLGSRLTANFSVETTRSTPVAVDSGSSAYGADGTVFEARTHTLASETNYLKVSASTFAGVPLFGSVNFYRTESVPSSLLLLSLIVYPDQPVPRWSPQFINVPVQ